VLISGFILKRRDRVKRILLTLLLTHINLSVWAQTCPSVSQVYRYDNSGKVIPIAPEGWMVAQATDRSSAPTRFWHAAWAQHRIDPRDEKRVLCIYGLTDTSWWQIETVNQVDKSLVSSHPEWVRYGNDQDDYYRCQRPNPEECPFG
jgi:hypothetical protein